MVFWGAYYLLPVHTSTLSLRLLHMQRPETIACLSICHTAIKGNKLYHNS